MLDKKFGLTVAGSRYEEVALAGAYFALTGVNLGLDLGGRSQSVPLQGEEQRQEQAEMAVDESKQRKKLEKLWREMSKKFAGYGSFGPKDIDGCITFESLFKIALDQYVRELRGPFRSSVEFTNYIHRNLKKLFNLKDRNVTEFYQAYFNCGPDYCDGIYYKDGKFIVKLKDGTENKSFPEFSIEDSKRLEEIRAANETDLAAKGHDIRGAKILDIYIPKLAKIEDEIIKELKFEKCFEYLKKKYEMLDEIVESDKQLVREVKTALADGKIEFYNNTFGEDQEFAKFYSNLLIFVFECAINIYEFSKTLPGTLIMRRYGVYLFLDDAQISKKIKEYRNRTRR